MTTIILSHNEKNVIKDAIQTRLLRIKNLIDKGGDALNLKAMKLYKKDIDTLNNLMERLTDEAWIAEKGGILIQTNILNIITELEQRKENYYNLLDSK